ncbi:hypothetical protein HaLaN_17311, partial [Haematococcus lacustris]
MLKGRLQSTISFTRGDGHQRELSTCCSGWSQHLVAPRRPPRSLAYTLQWLPQVLGGLGLVPSLRSVSAGLELPRARASTSPFTTA